MRKTPVETCRGLFIAVSMTSANRSKPSHVDRAKVETPRPAPANHVQRRRHKTTDRGWESLADISSTFFWPSGYGPQSWSWHEGFTGWWSCAKGERLPNTSFGIPDWVPDRGSTSTNFRLAARPLGSFNLQSYALPKEKRSDRECSDICSARI